MADGPTMQWLDRRREERLEQARADARRFFDGTEQEIPDLVFETPVCPICDLHTVFDEVFICEVCGVTWPSNGYGHQAEKIDGHPVHSGSQKRPANPADNGSEAAQ